MSKLNQVNAAMETSSCIQGDLKVINEVLSNLYDCAECGDPMTIGDISKAMNFALSVRELAASLYDDLDKLFP